MVLVVVYQSQKSGINSDTGSSLTLQQPRKSSSAPGEAYKARKIHSDGRRRSQKQMTNSTLTTEALLTQAVIPEEVSHLHATVPV